MVVGVTAGETAAVAETDDSGEVGIRQAHPADGAQWLALRAALWPDEDPASLAGRVDRFFLRREAGPGVIPEDVLLAEAADGRLVGFAEVSRRAYAEGCARRPTRRSASRKWS
jgi:hypothetical protein